MTNSLVIISIILGVISKPTKNYITIIISRFITGVYGGLFTAIIPLYTTECSPKNIRGIVGIVNQLALVTGILLVGIAGLPFLLGNETLWPVLFALSFLPVLVHIGLFFACESPKHIYVNLKNKLKAEEGEIFFFNFSYLKLLLLI